jgi:DNA polymerase
VVYLDGETYHPTGDIKTLGGYKYLQDASVLLLGWCVDDGPVQVWDATVNPMPPADLVETLESGHMLCAHNSQFDRVMLRECMGLDTPLEQWVDTMAQAYAHSLPPSLDALCKALKIPQDMAKLEDGKALVRKFCQPAPRNRTVSRYDRHNSPKEWARFVEYCRLDVVAMRECHRRMPTTNFNGAELTLWRLDQRINGRGVPINRKSAKKALDVAEDLTSHAEIELKRILQDDNATVSAVSKIKDYVNGRGLQIPNLQAATIKEALELDNLPDDVRQVLTIRKDYSKSSTKKFKILTTATMSDGRLRGTLQWCGASRTGRWAGRLFQPQNLPRQFLGHVALYRAVDGGADLLDWLYGDGAMDALSQAIRGMIHAEPGNKLVWADLSGIEARMLPWLADYDEALEVFRRGDDVYVITAAGIYRCSESKVDSDRRFVGKVATLSLGYQGGVGAFIAMAKNYGVKIGEDFAQDIVQAWRKANPTITSFWYDIENAVRDAICNPGATYRVRKVLIKSSRACLKIRLPSGRVLHYWRPKIKDRKYVDKETGEVSVKRNTITFWGTHQQSGAWVEQDTYGGKLVENITQAASRDVLAHALPLIEKAGYPIITTIHDEVVTEVPDEDRYSWQEVAEIMTINPPWSEGLPLGADGKEGLRYRK